MSESELPAIQQQLIQHLRRAVESSPDKQFVYYTEWLGYLPFGLYHWVKVDGQDVDIVNTMDGWGVSDLRELAAAGCLQVVDEWQHPEDHCETKTTFKVL